MEKLFSLARELATPQIWSAGVELARNADFQQAPSASPSEVSIRVVQGARDKVVTVSLSEEDEVWQCDCSGEDDPCHHVVATIIAVKQGRATSGAVRRSAPQSGALVHSFVTHGSYLQFERYFLFGEERVVVSGTLIQTVAALQREKRYVSPTEEELRIDYVLPANRASLDAKTMRHLLPALSRVRLVHLDGAMLPVSTIPLLVRGEVVDEDGGFRIRRVFDGDVSRVFDNGAAVRAGELCAVEDSALRLEDITLLRDPGTFYPKERGIELATRVIPSLQGRITIDNKSKLLPRARRLPARIVLEAISNQAGESLTVIPKLVYGDPIIAEVRGAGLDLVDQREIPIRDTVEEARLTRDLLARLGLRVGEGRSFNGAAATRFAPLLKGWSTSGDGVTRFTPADDLRPAARESAGNLEIVFESPRGDTIPAEEILKAWHRREAAIRLPSGAGWATLPTRWLEAHGQALTRLLESKDGDKAPHARVLQEVSEICESVGVSPPDYFARLHAALSDVESIPEAPLPNDLQATLRPYQRVGVNWLSFLGAHGLGALLADDMGLGKTLQALCVVKGRTLIVCPTSVISSWKQQIERFRPALSVSVYHGPKRSLDPNADVTLTSYSIVRLDSSILSKQSWSTLIFDEAQTIRNPESQVAQAAYSLHADAVINLSGTPVENSLDDLWSQFRVLNPGLLGGYEDFQRSFVEPIATGNPQRAGELRKRVAPFILRRLKRDVAKELPPKTEVMLQCELSEEERTVYEAVLGAARGDLLRHVGEEANVLSMLEALLRLRQACSHIGLIPGHEARSSSKIDLLIDSLRTSIAQGHRALVFSQWTSLLDRIEPHLRDSEIEFSRIDGSTEGRGDLVEHFQSPDGPPVMLLSLKAGGLGITLTRADHVYIVDPWWNPAVEDQAADRAYRIGQENPVIVHRLVAKDTIEERILQLQESKRALLETAVGAGAARALTRDEILGLLVDDGSD